MLEDGSMPIEKGISQVARSQLRHLGQEVRREEGSTLVCYCVHYSKIPSFFPPVLAAVSSLVGEVKYQHLPAAV